MDRDTTKWYRRARQWQAELDQLVEQVFNNEVVEGAPMTYWDESLWDSIEMFGLVLDTDTAYVESLKGFWIDQDSGSARAGYWVPEGYTSSIPTIDTPPTEEVAWDARPL